MKTIKTTCVDGVNNAYDYTSKSLEDALGFVTTEMSKETKKLYTEGFTFLDLFAGIGGFHLALNKLNGECVAASEINPHARNTYETNFKKVEPQMFTSGNFHGDICAIDPTKLPDFDIVCGGFPCQPFSIAGKQLGFKDAGRGNMFYKIMDIVKIKKPKAFILENVRNIVAHNGGKTIKEILKELDLAGYTCEYQVVSAADYGLPQLRKRTYFVGVRRDCFDTTERFIFPAKLPLKKTMSDIWGGKCTRKIGFTLRCGGVGSGIHDRRNWDSYMVDGVVRRLGVDQAKEMMGFPSSYKFPVSDRQAMRQLGNAVAVPCVLHIAKSLLQYMDKHTL